MREMRKIIFFIAMGAFLNSCAQYSSFLGPTYTIVESGNIYQAALSYQSNTLVKQKTGKDTFQHASEHASILIEKKNKQINLDEDLIALIETSIKKTRKKIISKK